MTQIKYEDYFMYEKPEGYIDIKISVEDAVKLNIIKKDEIHIKDYIECKISVDLINNNEEICLNIFYNNKEFIHNEFTFTSNLCDTIKNALSEFKDYEGNKKYIKIINDCKDEDIYYYKYNKYEEED